MLLGLQRVLYNLTILLVEWNANTNFRYSSASLQKSLSKHGVSHEERHKWYDDENWCVQQVVDLFVHKLGSVHQTHSTRVVSCERGKSWNQCGERAEPNCHTYFQGKVLAWTVELVPNGFPQSQCSVDRHSSEMIAWRYVCPQKDSRKQLACQIQRSYGLKCPVISPHVYFTPILILIFREKSKAPIECWNFIWVLKHQWDFIVIFENWLTINTNLRVCSW